MKRNPEDKQDILRELEYVCTCWGGKDPVDNCSAISGREPMWFQVYLVQGREEESQSAWDKIKDFISFNHRI
ncbi:hypothetical protein LS70_009480 [Helicobacter sp. MIT 11-5569]|uniref:hypothetical protein n=1 Tax=Helicobacter sp. MIT 11-5569 TaxID=1548151 RepID=UPI00051F9575|nr:hypothetical protein [Helicobacter sp. MIT 11-5569]TLD80013.1 hypothetical protein LS70_009480 [Helicobacter sp. MIT 11-5569]